MRRKPCLILTCLVLVCLILSGCELSREPALSGEVTSLRSQLGEARLQVRLLQKDRDSLAAHIAAAQALAMQLHRDVKYLQSSNTQLSDAVNRLSYEDWSKVVPDIQLRFSDVEGASQDLDTRTTQIEAALRDDQ